MPIDVTSDADLTDYVQRLRGLKIKKLGEGDFSQVFVHPSYPNVVVRISIEDGDDGYRQWLKFALANQNNPYVPKIYGTARGRTATSKLTIVFLERLDRATLGQFKSFVIHLNPKLRNATTNVLRSPTANFPEDLKDLRSRDKNLYEVANFLSRFRSEGRVDIVWKNVMMRDKNQPVLTDPVYG